MQIPGRHAGRACRRREAARGSRDPGHGGRSNHAHDDGPPSPDGYRRAQRSTANEGSETRVFCWRDPGVLTFVANFPPTLQDATIPDPTDSFDTQALHRFLPKTGTIGSMLHFYFIFWATPPYVPFVPLGGLETDLFFDDDVSNEALIELRRFVVGYIEKYEPDSPQIWQWERNIEL